MCLFADARDHHEALQEEDIDPNISPEEYDQKLEEILRNVPETQRLQEPGNTPMSWKLTEEQVQKALSLAKDGSATGLDGCPYELWKALQKRHDKLRHRNNQSFDIIKILTHIYRDIQAHGVDERTEFTMGWMCPLFKKKDPTDIRNYRLITLMNADYKLLTKTLAIQLMDHAQRLIHPDQAGFIPKRSIFNHIRLAKAILSYAEATEEDGAIIALDQEKAYDKIRHDYLWKIMNAFNLPQPFIQTVHALYSNAQTKVVINGVMSEPYQVQRGVRQGDPLSCPLFDLAIEPLACMIRNDPNIKGITIPGIEEAIKIKLFADDTSIFLNKDDSLDHLQTILNRWCELSGARFNIEKTEIIPMGSERHRKQVWETRKTNPNDENTIPERIKITRDKEAIRILSAWIGNKAKNATPWEPIIDTIKLKLEQWEKAHPTLYGKRLIIQTVVGGHTQFLAKAQGMPTAIEDALIKIINKFIWGKDSTTRIAQQTLQRPINEGGLNILDIKARNEAIELVWLKEYLNFTASRQQWAAITDHIVLAAAPTHSVEIANDNPFLQAWSVPQKGPRAEKLNDDIWRMFRVAKKHNTNLEAIKISPHILAQLPAWYHITAEQRTLNRTTARCLMQNHQVTKVADLVKISARIRHPLQYPTHQQNQECPCHNCSEDRTKGCEHPQDCASEALIRLNLIPPRYNPTQQGAIDGLSLTKSGKIRNKMAEQNNNEVTFDPSITCKENLAECFRIFTDPTKRTDQVTKRYRPHGPIPRCREITVYTDGACMNNGKKDVRSGSGIWFGHNNPKNRALRIPGDTQLNQVGELAAVIHAIAETAPYQPLRIITDSKYVKDGLTTNLESWENNGWIEVKNAPLFKKAAHLLRFRTARTIFQWVKGHNGTTGNEESDRLAKQGAEKPTPDELDLEIPIEYDIQGAKLAMITQAKAYRGILEKRTTEPRRSSINNIRSAREAIKRVTGNNETDASIWRNLRNAAVRPLVQQFLFKTTHNAYMVGKYWENIRGFEDRGTCATCNTQESMSHILTECNAPPTHLIWNHAKNVWPYDNIRWPEIDLGIIIGCGSLHLLTNNAPRENDQQNAEKIRQGPTCLLQILISEAAYLIWAMRCERTMQGKTHNANEIKGRWLRSINERLTTDKIQATTIKRNKGFTELVVKTWEQALSKECELPIKWIYDSEVLVGRTAQRTQER